MSDPRPTSAQLRALEAIRDDKVKRYRPWGGGEPSWTAPRGIRADVITRCIDARWAKVGPRINALHSPVVLTDAGASVLAASTPKES